MKKTVAILCSFLLCSVFHSAIAQQPHICSEPGTVLEYETRDKNGNVTERMRVTVTGYTETERGAVISQSNQILQTQQTDVKIPVVTQTIRIDGHNVIQLKENILATLRSTFDALDKSGSNTTRDYVVTGNDMVSQANPNPGTTNPDYEITVKMLIMDIDDPEDTGSSFNITLIGKDRSVLRRERITVPAGGYDCVVSQETVSVRAMGGLLRKNKTTQTWTTPGIGRVMSREVDGRGRTLSETRLMSISLPR